MATARNTAAVLSDHAPADAVGDACTFISVWDAETGGNFLGSQSITTETDPLVLDERFRITAGGIVLTQPTSTQETAKLAVRALRGRIGTQGLWIRYHSGDPGSDGSANAIPVARTNIPTSNWTFAE